MLMNMYRVLALLSCFWDSRRHRERPCFRPRCFSDRPFFSRWPRQCYGHRFNRRNTGGHHLPSGAGKPAAKARLCLEYACDGFHFHFHAHHWKRPPSLSITTQEGL